MKKLILLLFAITLSSSLKAEESQIVYGATPIISSAESDERGKKDREKSERSRESVVKRRPYSIEESPSQFKMYKLISPASPLVLGSLTLYVVNAEELDTRWSDLISSGHGTVSFDDYLQYSPTFIMWGLNAFGGQVQPYHKFKQQTTILLMSSLASLALVQGTKEFVRRKRPDTGASNSFPSGHTATAFMCAEILHHEYGEYSPWISILGYSLAATTGYMRVYNERHYIGDIIAGAGVGMLSARLAYWLAPKVNRALWGSATGYESEFTASLMPYTYDGSYGVGLSIRF